MRIIFLSILALLIMPMAVCQTPVINTVNGPVSGIKKGEVSIFKGIPFAAPPVGDLRWKAPQPAPTWTEVRKCETFSASPMQGKPVPFMMWTEEFIAPPEPLSEDCLYLNVWTSAKTAHEKLPVFVWIYGGGFVSGSAACAIYDGEEFARRGIVFVSINYRVGAFGFLAHPELTKESAGQASGNYAFLDQLAALQWIQKNITAFGGDPNNVTIAGQSAGSFSINALVASPLGKGLFHKAIAQSGGLLGTSRARRLKDAEKSGVNFVEKAKAGSINKLRSASAEEIQQFASTMSWGSFSPVLDGYVLPENLLTHFQEGKHNDVPLLTGWVTGDATLNGNANLPPAKFKEESIKKYGSRSDEFLKLFPADSNKQAKASQLKLGLCDFAALPSHLWATYNKSDAYLYQFGFVPTDKPNFPNHGAFHTSEVPYALHTLHLWNRPWQARDREMERVMSEYWMNFIRTGNPNGVGLNAWKPYKVDGAVQVLGDQISTSPLLKKELAFLEASLNKK